MYMMMSNTIPSLTWLHKVITRSAVRSALHTSPNQRLVPSEEEEVQSDLNLQTFVYDGTTSSGEPTCMSTLTFDDLLGRTFLLPPQENGKLLQAKFIKQVTNFENDQQAQEDQLRIKIQVLVTWSRPD